MFITLLIILLWPLGHLISLPSLLPNLNLHPLDFLLFIQSLLLIRNYKAILRDPLSRPLFIFSLVALLSVIFSPLPLTVAQSLVALGYLVRFLLVFSLYYAIKLYPRPIYLHAAFFSALLFIFLGLSQYIFFPDMRFLRLLGFDDHYFRLISPLFDPNFTGLVFTILFFVFLYLQQNTPLKYFLLLLTLLSIALTFSRASYLSLFAGSLVYLFTSRRFSPKIIATFFFFILLLFLIPKPFGEGVNLLRTYSITSRLQNVSKGLTLFYQHPWLGVGFNATKFLSSTSLYPNRVGGIDNSFVHVLVTTGLLGFMAFLYLLSHMHQRLRPTPITLAIIIATITHSLFNNSLFFLWFQLELIFLYALATRRS